MRFLILLSLLVLVTLSENAIGQTSSYATLKVTLDDGYHLVGKDKVLRFKFLEEYFVNPSSNKLKFLIYDSNRSIQNSKLAQALTEKFGENFEELSVAGLASNQYYVLEVYNQKGEKWYLRFKTP